MNRNPNGLKASLRNRFKGSNATSGAGTPIGGKARHPDANEIAAALKDYSEKKVGSKSTKENTDAEDQKQVMVALGHSIQNSLQVFSNTQAERNARWAELMTPPKPAVRSAPPSDPQTGVNTSRVSAPIQLVEKSAHVDNTGKQAIALLPDTSQPFQSQGKQNRVKNALVKRSVLKNNRQGGPIRKKASLSDKTEIRRPRPEDETYSPKSDDDNKRKCLRAYFGIKPMWTVICCLLGLFCMFHPWRLHSVYGFEVSIDWAFLGGLFLVTLSVLWRYFSVAKPGDPQVDGWIAEDIGTLELRAHDLMNLNQSEMICDPLAFLGYPDLERIKGISRYSRYGIDQVLRYTPRALTVLCFTKEEVIAYEGAIDLTTGNQIYESVRHFFYRDITTVGLVKSVVVKNLWSMSHLTSYLAIWRWSFVDYFLNILSGNGGDRSGQNKSQEIYRIGLTDGSSVNIILRDGRFSGDRINEQIPISTDDAVLQFALDIITKQKNQQMGKVDYNAERPALFVPSTRRKI